MSAALTMTINTGAFLTSMERRTEIVVRNTEIEVKEAGLLLKEALERNNPVGTAPPGGTDWHPGLSRDNWRIREIPGGVAVSNSGPYMTHKGEIQNYILALEQGYSDQAPGGILTPAIAEAMPQIAAQFANMPIDTPLADIQFAAEENRTQFWAGVQRARLTQKYKTLTGTAVRKVGIPSRYKNMTRYF